MKDHRKHKRSGMERNIRKTRKSRLLPVRLLCILVLLFAGTMLLRDLGRYHRERVANQELAQQVRQAREAADANDGISQDSRKTADASDNGSQDVLEATDENGSRGREAESALLAQYALLHRQNADFAGWLYIEDTVIDYPVMYTPDDPERYLHKAFDGSYAQSGSLFIDASCTPESNHILIHGHHMKDGSMFGTLPRYQDAEYAEKHSVIRFDTPEEAGCYELLAAFYTEITDGQEGDTFQYYAYTDLSDPADFDTYIRQVKKLSVCDTDTQAVYGDRILTLSTCSYHTEEGRFVVVAVKKDP